MSYDENRIDNLIQQGLETEEQFNKWLEENSQWQYIQPSTIQDVKTAFEFGKQRLSFMDQLSGEWIYGVDPETMDEVKAIYSKADGDASLYGVFCKILKLK